MNGKSKVGRNALYKNKKLTKLSSITDVNGIPLSLIMDSGNKHDSILVDKNLENLLITTNKPKYMLADSAYDTNKIRNKLNNLNYIPIIPQNIRNIKNKNKITNFNSIYSRNYKKRIRIENYFCKLKKFRRILMRYDRYDYSFLNFVFLATCIILYRRNF